MPATRATRPAAGCGTPRRYPPARERSRPTRDSPGKPLPSHRTTNGMPTLGYDACSPCCERTASSPVPSRQPQAIGGSSRPLVAANFGPTESRLRAPRTSRGLRREFASIRRRPPRRYAGRRTDPIWPEDARQSAATVHQSAISSGSNERSGVSRFPRHPDRVVTRDVTHDFRQASFAEDRPHPIRVDTPSINRMFVKDFDTRHRKPQ